MMDRKWEASKFEKYAEKWLARNGYTFEIKKEYVSKTVYMVHKDGYSLEFHAQNYCKNYKTVMEMFEQNFKGHIALLELRKQYNAINK